MEESNIFEVFTIIAKNITENLLNTSYNDSLANYKVVCVGNGFQNLILKHLKSNDLTNSVLLIYLF